MGNKKDLLTFLFGESAELESAESDRHELNIAENLDRLMEVAAEAEIGELEAKKTPLAKALGELGIKDAAADLQLDTEGFVLATDNHERYVDAMTVLGSAEAMHKLAEMGWVVTKTGDPAMTNEPPNYRIRFLEITTVDANDRDPKGGTYDTANREEVIKKAQKFATTPMDRDDDLNPVENDDGKMGKKDVGVGKAKAGEDPEKAIHDALMSGDPDRILEFTSTGSMGTAMSMGQPGAGIVKKPKPYGKGTTFKMPGQWTVKQPVVNKQVKRHVRSEATDPVEKAAQDFLSEEDDSEAYFAGTTASDRELIPPGTFGNPGGNTGADEGENADQEAYQDMKSELESGEAVVFDDSRASAPTRVMFGRDELGIINDEEFERHHRPFAPAPQGVFRDVAHALRAVNAEMERRQFWPNIYHINDHGNVSLWDKNGKEVRSWV